MNQGKCNHSKIWILALAWFPIAGFSQNTLYGSIVDAANGEPVPFVSVFFNNTTIGTATRVDGTFEIKYIPNGKYDLTVSAVGYKRLEGSFEFPRQGGPVKIEITQEPIDLSPVTVIADQGDYKKYFPDFKKYFIGESANSRRCVILNPLDVHLYYDPETRILTGHASKALIIENKQLGYRLHYILDHFELDYKNSVKKTLGIPRFEELPVEPGRVTRVLERNRLRAYEGSMDHFMRSLYQGKLKEEGFNVSITDATHMSSKPVVLEGYLTGESVKTLTFQGILKLEYVKEAAPYEYSHSKFAVGQISFLEFKNPSVEIFENGYFVEQLGIFMQGYLAWSETLGEMIPKSYNPPQKEK